MNRSLQNWTLLLLAAISASPSEGRGAEQISAERSKLHLVMIIAEDEYKTEQTLPLFAKANLAEDFRVTILEADQDDPNSISGLDSLESADVVLVSVRRRPLKPGQLKKIRNYLAAGKPIVAIRTASHAFCLRNKPAPEGLADWPEFDPQVLGGHYVNHHGNQVQSFVQVNAKQTAHPILAGFSGDEFRVFGSLYCCQPLAESTTLLMTGRAEGIEQHEPVAWTNRLQSDNRVFYTSLGHPHDFKLPDFVRLLRNGVYWAADLPTPNRPVITLENPPDK